MKHIIYTVSNSTLKKDIRNRKRLAERTFTMSSYIRQEDLEKRSEQILDSFAEGHLTLEKNQYKLFAKYIDVFGRWQTEACLKRLQGMADFDVKEYIKSSNISWWDKIFNKKTTGIKAKTPFRLKREMKCYVKACRKGDEFKAHDLRQEAENYVASFVNDKFALPKEDENIFKAYIKTILYPVYEGDNADKALKKIRAHEYQVAETSTGWMTVATTQVEKVSANIKGFFSNIAEKIVKAPQKIKFSSFSISEKHKQIASRVIKVCGLAGLLTVGTIWGANKCSGDDKDSVAQNNIEQFQTRQKDVADVDSLTFHFEPVSNLSWSEYVSQQNFFANKNQAQTQEKTTMDAQKQAVRQAVVNHHNHVLNKRLGAKGKEALYAEVESQINKGIFTLPDSLGKEEFAYALTMYRAYGVESSLQNARTTTTKLTAAENAQVIQDIVDAGDTGLGVQKKAAQIRLQMHKGPLDTSNGLYNRMSKKDQHKHNVNLQQWRNAKRLARG